MVVDTSGMASSVFGIAGMGIGLGLLAHTAGNIARSTDRMYDHQGYKYRYGQGRKEFGPRRGRGLKDTKQRDTREGFGSYPRQRERSIRSIAPRRSFGSGFVGSSLRFNPQPMSLTRSARSFRW